MAKGSSVAKLLTIEEAASALSVSTRTVQTYVSKSFLTPLKKKRSNRVLFDASEVAALREEKQQKKVVRRTEVVELHLRIRRLEERVEVLSTLLDSRLEPLRLQPDDAQAILLKLRVDSARTEWPDTDIQAWIGFFRQADENDIEVLYDVCGNPLIWSVFLQFLNMLSKHTRESPNYASSDRLQDRLRAIHDARTRWRTSAALFDAKHRS